MSTVRGLKKTRSWGKTSVLKVKKTRSRSKKPDCEVKKRVRGGKKGRLRDKKRGRLLLGRPYNLLSECGRNANLAAPKY
jgi:hypothetical protein